MTNIRTHRPRFARDDACTLARQHYALDVSARDLPSERDQNFQLIAADGSEFVLKIASAAEDESVLDFQNKALQHLAKQGDAEQGNSVLAPRLYPTLAGDIMTTIPAADGASHFVRLLTYLPGKPLATVAPHRPYLLQELGHYLGMLDQALSSFSHPAQNRKLHWDLQYARATVNEHLSYITDPQKRALVDQFRQHVATHATPLLPHLRTSVIQSDANDYNVIVARDSARLSIAGVIDFGDMVHSYTVGELAIAVAYAMLHKDDPLAAASHVIRGYHAAYPLTADEMAALFPLACLRLCTSVVMSAYQFSQEPENAYLRVSETPAWQLLKKLADIHPNLAHYTVRHACGLEPCPQAPRIVQWLRQQDAAPLIDQDLGTERTLVLDLSIGSPDLGDLSTLRDVATFTSDLFARMSRAGVDVAIGQHNEARPIYAGELFETKTATPESDHVMERRTVHLGLDLFIRAGAAIYAPLNGTVHSFANNTALYDYGPTIILEHVTDEGDRFYTLYGHLSTESLDDLAVGQSIAKGERIATVGDYPVNGNWPPHLHFQLITDILDNAGEFAGVAAPSVRDLWCSISPDPNALLRIPTNRFPPPAQTKADLLTARHDRLGPSLSISYNKPLKIVRGLGQYLYDECGRAYLDAVNNVPHVGHCHPHVTAAGQRQMAVLNTNTRYLHDMLVDLRGTAGRHHARSAQRLLLRLFG